MRNPNLSQAALLFALTLTQLVCGGDNNSSSGCIEPPRNLPLVLREVDGPLYLKDKPPYLSQSEAVHFDGGGCDPNQFNRIEDLVQQGHQTGWLAPIWLGLALVFGATLGCLLDLGSTQRPRRWWRSTENDTYFRQNTTCGHLRLGRLLLTTTVKRGGAGSILNPLWNVWLLMEVVLGFAGVTVMVFHAAMYVVSWLWVNRRKEIRSGNRKNPIRIWVSKSLWVAMPSGCGWTHVQIWCWVTSMARVLSLWWMSDRPKLMAAPSLWWSPAEKLLLGLQLVGPPSGLGALVSCGLLWGSRMSSGAFSLDGSLVQPEAWKINSEPGLFGSGMTGGFLYPPSR